MRYVLNVQTKDQTDGTVEMGDDDVLVVARLHGSNCSTGEVVDVVVGSRIAVATHLKLETFVPSKLIEDALDVTDAEIKAHILKGR